MCLPAPEPICFFYFHAVFEGKFARIIDCVPKSAVAGPSPGKSRIRYWQCHLLQLKTKIKLFDNCSNK